MNTFVYALFAGAFAFLCPMSAALAESTADENAAAAIFRAMEHDIERCFAGLHRSAFVLVEALVDDGGHVRRVETSGDARASPATRRCVERRVGRARFPVPLGGGTSRVRTAYMFTLE